MNVYSNKSNDNIYNINCKEESPAPLVNNNNDAEDDDAKDNTNGGEEDAELNEEQNEAPSPLVDAVQGGDLAADDAEEEEEAMDVDEVSIIIEHYYFLIDYCPIFQSSIPFIINSPLYIKSPPLIN